MLHINNYSLIHKCNWWLILCILLEKLTVALFTHCQITEAKWSQMLSFSKRMLKNIPEDDNSGLFVLKSHGSIYWSAVQPTCALLGQNLGLLFPSRSWLIGHQWRHAPRMSARTAGLSSKQTWKSRPAKSLVSPYHPLGRQSRISCICGQTRPPPLPRIARLLQNHASVCSISLTFFFKGWNSHNHVVCFWSLGLPKSHCLSLKSTKINSPQWKHFQPCWKNFS